MNVPLEFMIVISLDQDMLAGIRKDLLGVKRKDVLLDKFWMTMDNVKMSSANLAMN